jgi:hypothetical protein
MAAFEVIALDTATPQLRAPGASDTYTFPRAVEMPLGTANGVLYLDGSKVVTSGSALTFDGTRLTINSGATSEALRLNATANTYLSFQRNGTGTAYIQSASGGMYVWNQENTAIQFGVNNTEQMRLTSTGLGIGTSSPGNKLHVQGSGDVARFTNGTNSAYFALDSAGFTLFTGAGQTGNGLYAKASDNSVQLWTNSSVKATLDSSGNVGIGATPSAWGSGTTALEVGAVYSKLSSSGTYGGALTNNAYYNSGWKYEGANFATLYLTAGGVHSWHTAASGTAGDPISFTQAMTLDASGSLLVGSTSGTYRLSISVSSGADRDIFLAGVTGTSNGFHVRWINSTGKTHVIIADIPTSSAGLSAGTLWNDGGTLKIA